RRSRNRSPRNSPASKASARASSSTSRSATGSRTSTSTTSTRSTKTSKRLPAKRTRGGVEGGALPPEPGCRGAQGSAGRALRQAPTVQGACRRRHRTGRLGATQSAQAEVAEVLVRGGDQSERVARGTLRQLDLGRIREGTGQKRLRARKSSRRQQQGSICATTADRPT